MNTIKQSAHTTDRIERLANAERLNMRQLRAAFFAKTGLLSHSHGEYFKAFLAGVEFGEYRRDKQL